MNLDLPQPGSNRELFCQRFIEGFMTSVIVGSKTTRAQRYVGCTDTVIQEIFGWQREWQAPVPLAVFVVS